MEAVDAFAQHDELVAAQTGDRIGFTYGPSDPAGRLYENLVTDRVAQRVVDRFEPIEVDVQHGGHAIVPANAGESSFEPIAEHQPVW